MLGLISQGPQSDPEVQARRGELTRVTAGDVLGAALAEGFSESPGPRMGRIIARGYVDQGDGTYVPLNATDELGMPTGQLPPSPMVPLEVLKREYDIPGVLSFDKDTPQSVAQSLYDHKRAQMIRADTISRSENMLASGMASRFVASMLGSLGDPVNLAAMFVPGINEATMARIMAVSAGAGAGARAAVRAGAGATAGAFGMAALEPLNYALTRQERDDWTFAGALANVLLGTVAGAGIHSGMGALMERTRGLPDWSPARVASERFQEAPPEVQQAIARHAVAAQAEGRPPEVAALLDLSESLEAVAQMRRLAEAQTRIEAEAAQDLAAVRAQREQAGRRNAPEERAARLDETAARLREEADSLRADMARVRDRATVSAMDPETAARLEAVDTELAGTIPAARRRALEAERTMLMEGRVDRADDLTAGRDAAELKGLQAALDRAEAGADRAEAAMALARKEAEVVQEQRAALAKQADAGERAAMSRLEARQAVVDDNAARAMRQIAAALDSQLSPAQARELGRAVARGQATMLDAIAAIQRWKSDFAAIDAESLAGFRSNSALAEMAEREAARLESGARESFDRIANPPVDTAAGEPPRPASRTGLAPPDPPPAGEPGAASKAVAEQEKAIAELDRQIAAATGATPAPREGYVRLYHGAAGQGPETGGGRWVSADQKYAEGYAANGPHNTVYYIDLPETHPLVVKHTDTNMVEGTGMKAPINHFELPEPMAKQLREFVPVESPLIERLKEFDKLVDEEARVDAAVFETAANCLVRVR